MDVSSGERPKLYQPVLASLQRMIRDGTFKPGDELPSERDLSERFGVGRPSIRQALFALDRMGVIKVRNGGRPRVQAPNPDMLLNGISDSIGFLLMQADWLEHFQDCRLLFEVALVRNAAESASRRDLDGLAAALEENRCAVGDIAAFQRTDIAFHYELATITRNPAIEALYQASRDWLSQIRSFAYIDEAHDRFAFRAHERIYRAVAEHDPERAETEMRRHLHEVREQQRSRGRGQ